MGSGGGKQVAGTPAPDWTTGAAKWAAVVLLGGASLVGIVWSIARDVRDAREGAARPFAARSDNLEGPGPAPRQRAGEPDDHPATAPVTPRNESGRAPLAAKLDLNAATQTELELLPGVGPALAARIVEFRSQHGPFRSVEQLDAVKGIGPKLMEKIRPLVKVGEGEKK